MDDMGQRGGGVFFMLTFSQPAYSFIESSSRAGWNIAESHTAFLPVLTLVWLVYLKTSQRGHTRGSSEGNRNSEKRCVATAVTSFTTLFSPRLRYSVLNWFPQSNPKEKRRRRRSFKTHERHNFVPSLIEDVGCGAQEAKPLVIFSYMFSY